MTPAFWAASRHGVDHLPQDRNCQAFFEDEPGAEIKRVRTSHGQVVDGAVNGQAADVASGKDNGIDDIAVGGHGERGGHHRQQGAVIHFREKWVGEGFNKKLADEFVSGAAAAAMVELDGVRFHMIVPISPRGA